MFSPPRRGRIYPFFPLRRKGLARFEIRGYSGCWWFSGRRRLRRILRLSGSGSPKPSVIPPTIEMSLPLKLSVSEKQNQLDVTWDRNAPVILLAKRGVLSISDGLNKRDLDLSGAQLRTGRVLYSRLSADVAASGGFADGSNPVTESIRIVSTEPRKRPLLKHRV